MTTNITTLVSSLDRRHFLGTGALFILLPVLPDILPGVTLGSITRGVLFGITALGLALLIRHTMLVSFGNMAYFGLGAYAAAFGATYLQVRSAILLFVLAIAAGTLAAIVVGYIISSHQDIYFALLTLGFAGLVHALAIGSELTNYSDGLSVRTELARPTFFGAELPVEVYELGIYYLAAVCLVVLLFFAWQIITSPFGRALQAIGQNRQRATFIGINVRRYVWAVFVISGLYAGVAGGLFALLELHIRPGNTLSVFRSGELLVMVIVGGFRTLLGPIAGGFLITYLLDTVRFYTDYYYTVTGIVLLTVVYLLPDGIVGTLIRRSQTADGKTSRRWLSDGPAVVVDSAKQALGWVKFW
jgi:branched-chain amino acid transport system permease protein